MWIRTFGWMALLACCSGCGGGAGDPDAAARDAGDASDGDGGAADGGLDAGRADSGSGEDAGASPACIGWTGTRLLGTSLDDEASDVLLTGDGAIVVVGYEGGRADIANVVPAGESRAVVYRVEPDGDARVEGAFDEPGPDAFDRLAFDGDRLVVVGRTSVVGPDSARRFDVLLGVHRPEGIDPIASFGGAPDDRPTGLSVVDGRTWVVGFEEVFVGSGGGVERFEDGFLARAAGSDVDRWTAQTTAAESFWALATRDDLVVIGGVVFDGPARGPVVRAFDLDLAPTWSSTLPRGLGDAVTWLGFDAAGDLLGLGALTSTAGDQQVTLLRVGVADGAITRVAEHGGADAEWPTDAAPRPDGGLVVVGESVGGIERPSAGAHDVFVLWLASDGTLEAIHELGTPGDDHPAAVAVDPCGSAVVVGYTTGPLDGAPPLGRRDAFIHVVAQPR